MVRYKPSQFTKRELEIMVSALALDKGLDFLTGGRLNKWSRKAAIKIVKTTLPLALRVGSSVGLSTARAALPLVTNPYIAGTALGLGALQTEPGQQLLEAADERGRMDRIRLEQALTDLEIGVGKGIKRTKSKFNSAVSRGMKAIKNSTSYGKKGVINAPKKAFKAVVSQAAKLTKGIKPGHRMPVRPKTKTLKVIYNSMIGLFR
jgi:hypothetical protein